jgi:hypothetical protein
MGRTRSLGRHLNTHDTLLLGLTPGTHTPTLLVSSSTSLPMPPSGMGRRSHRSVSAESWVSCKTAAASLASALEASICSLRSWLSSATSAAASTLTSVTLNRVSAPRLDRGARLTSACCALSASDSRPGQQLAIAATSAELSRDSAEPSLVSSGGPRKLETCP